MSTLSALAKKSKYHLLNVKRIIRLQSPFKVVFVTFFASAFEVGLLVLFLDGFKFFDRMGGEKLMIIRHLFALFFLGMGIMLVVSSIITSYSTIFRSREIPFLLVRPFEMSEIVSYKFIESTGLSSWAFFFIVIPFVGAYAVYKGISILFILWTFLFSLPFLIVCSGIGTILAILLVRWFPRGSFMKILTIIITAAACGFAWWFNRKVDIFAYDAQFNLTQLVPGLSLASSPFLPNWWMSEGIMSLARGQWIRGVMLGGVLLSTAMLIYVIVEWLGTRTFYEAWQRVAGGTGRKRRAPVLLRHLDRSLSFLANDTRAMIMKDLRTFLRDPMQWSQMLIFFGLLGLYFVNLRTFHYHALPDSWRNIIAFLNVFSMAAIMCSLGSRFIYPLLSLEGQGFWVLGLSPTTISKVLITKFVTVLIGMLVVSVSLMLISSGMMNVAWTTKAVAVTLACAISLAICGLSTGLGAIFLDLKQQNPVAIVSGFGGTLNLVLSLGFMMAAILPYGLVFHLYLIHQSNLHQLHRGLWLATAWLFFITVITTGIPLWLGNRSLRSREF